MTDLKIGSLFSGVGGLDLAVESFFDAETAWHCEWEPEPSKVLAARWPGVPNFGDVTAVDWSTVEPVDIICGGFPCQDLSLAGRRSGMRPGTRSGLWADFLRAIDALKPEVVVIENVRGLLSGCAESASDSELGQCKRCLDPDGGASHSPNVRALGRVLGDLSELGFDAEWHGLLASDIGAPHGRFRVFVLAYAQDFRHERRWPAREWRAGSKNGSQRVVRAVDLLPTPTTAPETGNGHARNLGKEIALLPTPDASNANDGEQLDTWLARRERVKLAANNGNGMGMPLAIAALLLLPTPQVADATGGHARRGGDRSDELLLPGLAEAATAGALLPTPRASRGASSTETMYALGAIRDDEGDAQGNVTSPVSWGKYEPAVQLWETITRPRVAPTRPDGKGGRDRLNPELSEWMQGYPLGWVTSIIGRDASIKACGNGVVPQQAFAALGVLWSRALEWIKEAA